MEKCSEIMMVLNNRRYEEMSEQLRCLVCGDVHASKRDCEDVLEYSESDMAAAEESVTRFMLEELDNTWNP